MTAAASTLLTIHGAWRWVVLVTSAGCVGRSVHDILQDRPWNAVDGRWALAFVGAFDVQLTLGLILLVVMHAPRAYAAHVSLMAGALVIAHLGNVAVKRAAPDVAPRKAAMFFGGACLVIIAGIPWASPLLRL